VVAQALGVFVAGLPAFFLAKSMMEQKPQPLHRAVSGNRRGANVTDRLKD
jgi:hypothetical protein